MTFGVIHEVAPFLGVSITDQIEAMIACEFRGNEDGDRYSNGMEAEVIC